MTGPISASVLGRLGLDYQPARELTVALVGFAAAGVVLKDPSVRARLTNEREMSLRQRGASLTSPSIKPPVWSRLRTSMS